mmetsp:Transcript_20538/g.59535  ORF Transcript_20538/g.59535 Transcript_20538/m.59535 type:complete len:224 (-) Transcript_20538:127-798(-)
MHNVLEVLVVVDPRRDALVVALEIRKCQGPATAVGAHPQQDLLRRFVHALAAGLHRRLRLCVVPRLQLLEAQAAVAVPVQVLKDLPDHGGPDAEQTPPGDGEEILELEGARALRIEGTEEILDIRISRADPDLVQAEPQGFHQRAPGGSAAPIAWVAAHGLAELDRQSLEHLVAAEAASSLIPPPPHDGPHALEQRVGPRGAPDPLLQHPPPQMVRLADGRDD